MPDDAFPDLTHYEILDSLGEGVTLADSEGRIVFSNTLANRILGVDIAEGNRPDEWAEHYGVFLADGRTPFPTDQYPLVRALSGERTRDVEMVIRNATIEDGVIISVSGQPIHDANGTLVGAAVVFRDITELRRVQSHLKDTIVRLEDAQRVRDELSSFFVHDLKNPLSGILTTCSLIAMNPHADEVLIQDVDAMSEAARRIHGMVVDLLDIHLSEDGGLEPDVSHVELAGLFSEVVAAVKPRLASVHQTITVRDPGSSAILADRALLARVLINLVDNCAKYGPREGAIWIDTVPGANGSVVIRVRDEGPGIQPDVRERVFEKWAKVEREEGSRSTDSRGLGLRFCKVVADAHGGTIWVEDPEGPPPGARFCLELPLAH